MRRNFSLSVIGACLVTACATSRAKPEAIDTSSARDVAIFRGADGARVSWEELVDAAASADVVFIGENHGHPLGLASAAALFEDVLARAPSASLSLEFIERDEQSRLDDYLAGVSDLPTFERRAERKEGNFPPGHRAMVEAAKRAGRPVHAANAPWQYATLARKQGYERLLELTPEQQRLFRIPSELATGRYRADFEQVMTPTDPNDRPPALELARKLDAAFRAQQLWDWTMAESIARGLIEREQPVVHVIGHFHVDFAGGTVQALQRMSLGARVIVITFLAATSNALRDEDRDRADFVIYVGPSGE